MTQDVNLFVDRPVNMLVPEKQLPDEFEISVQECSLLGEDIHVVKTNMNQLRDFADRLTALGWTVTKYEDNATRRFSVVFRRHHKRKDLAP